MVVDGVTPERTQEAVDALDARLQGHPKLFKSVVEPDGGPFFAKNGLLFTDTDQVKKAMGGLQQAQPVLSILSSDQSLRGIFDAMQFITKGVASGRGTFDQYEKPITSLDGALQNILRRQAGVLLLAEPAGAGREAQRAPVAQVHPDHAVPRLQGAGARREADRLRASGHRRPAPVQGHRRRRADHRPGADLRQRVRDGGRRLRPQRRDHRGPRAADHLFRAEVVQDRRPPFS